MNMQKIAGLTFLCFIAISSITITVYEWRKSEGTMQAALQDQSLQQMKGEKISSESRISQLEHNLAALQKRLDELEKDKLAGPRVSSNQYDETLDLADNITAPNNLRSRPWFGAQSGSDDIHDNLISAGVDPSLAEQIANKTNDIALERLNLRDQAMRDGYINTEQYREELRSLNESNSSLREDIGEDYYDRFLYNSGQANRVMISSVMRGSAAASAGIQDGDTLLTYDGQRLFNGRELQGKTTTGERGELVDLTVLRDGQAISLNVPRGPLGVRLSQNRVDPGPS
jgi:C-terminal processing protease CtpA/Prc